MTIKAERFLKLWSKVFKINTSAIAAFPFVVVRKKGNKVMVNHERIHLFQWVGILLIVIPVMILIDPEWSMWIKIALCYFSFPIIYVIFHYINRIKGMDHETAYYNNPFEKEAYANQYNFKYLKERKLYSWIAYMRNL